MIERMFALMRQAWSAGACLAARWRNDAGFRERQFGKVVFSGILALTIVSFDYLITGGPDWNPGAPTFMQEAHAASVERRMPIAVARFEEIAVAPAPIEVVEEDLAAALLSADDLLGGPDAIVFAADERARFQLAAYSPSAAKPQRAADADTVEPRPTVKHKAPAAVTRLAASD